MTINLRTLANNIASILGKCKVSFKKYFKVLFLHGGKTVRYFN